MKSFIKKVVKKMSHWPIIGRLIRIGVAVVRLPDFRDQHIAFTQQQIPALLNTVSNLSSLKAAPELDNIIRSVPISLREIERNRRMMAREWKNDKEEILSSLNEVTEDYSKNIEKISNDIVSLEKVFKEHEEKHQRSLVEIVEKNLHDIVVLEEKIKKNLKKYEVKNKQNSIEIVEKISHDIVTLEEKLQKTFEEHEEKNQRSSTDITDIFSKLEVLYESSKYLTERIEFVRREIMYEIKYKSNKADDALSVSQKIINQLKYNEALTNKTYVNLGCGHIPKEGYLNVDRRELPSVDIVSEIDDLPFKEGQVDMFFSSHVLEHFPQEHLTRLLLPYFYKLLKKGGRFRAIVPDIEAMINAYQNDGYLYNDFREVVYGAQDYEGDFHFNMFTPNYLKHLLFNAGFKEVEIVDKNRKNGNSYEFEIEGIK